MPLLALLNLPLYAFKKQEFNRLSDTATDGILENTRQLLEQNEENLRQKVKKCIQNNGIYLNDISELENLLSSDPESASVYVVKRQSSLNNSKFFHVVDGLPSDIMHSSVARYLEVGGRVKLKQMYRQNICDVPTKNHETKQTLVSSFMISWS